MGGWEKGGQQVDTVTVFATVCQKVFGLDTAERDGRLFYIIIPQKKVFPPRLVQCMIHN